MSASSAKYASINWPTSVEEARALQLKLREKVIRQPKLPRHIHRVAGVDVGFENGGAITRAAVAVLGFPGLELLEKAVVRSKTRFPYVPGYLSFREAPAILKALASLSQQPDLILVDGQGLAHPRRFGIACHLGVVSGIATIGVAKSRLIGDYEEPAIEKGCWSSLMHYSSETSEKKDEEIGAVLRTRSGVKPLFISIGHKVDLATSIDYVLRCTTRYRLPETTRWAHKLASGN